VIWGDEGQELGTRLGFFSDSLGVRLWVLVVNYGVDDSTLYLYAVERVVVLAEDEHGDVSCWRVESSGK
jgi:hypothetical protein